MNFVGNGGLMVWVTFLSLIVTTLSYAGNYITARVHAIDKVKGEEAFIYLSTGDVGRTEDLSIIGKLEIAHKKKSWMRFQLTNARVIENVQLTVSPLQTEKRLIPATPSQAIYEPTLIENLELAQEYFREARYVDKESQCFNRAHVWSYEWFVKHAINSNKTWIFFTRRYIRKFKFKWWFHVSPSVQVMENGFPTEKIMDIKYARGPLPIHRWTEIFMRDRATCPLVKTYSDYANYPETGSCFLMNTSMFYYQPFDIESKETWETMKANWYDSEIKEAYLEAFDEVI
jgi:hypothetical protein